jgi:GNAT superfamily N-acetyltransferase
MTPETPDIDVRPGGAGDIPAMFAMLDGAVAWLVARGRTGQWGTEPFSGDPARVATARRWAETNEIHIAEIDGVPVGALVVGSAPDYAPPVEEPELYINLLVTDRARAGLGIGARLLDTARAAARARGVTLVRVDCYAGDDRALVRFYERHGFTATEPFTVDAPTGPWPGQTLEHRLA